MGLLASGADLKRYGFQITRSQLTDIAPFLKRTLWFVGDVCFWKEIQDKFIEMKGRVPVLEGTDWIYTFDFDKVNIRFNQMKLLLKIRIGSIKQGFKKFLIRILYYAGCVLIQGILFAVSVGQTGDFAKCLFRK